MSEDWAFLEDFPQRMSWARQARGKFGRPVDAARSLNIRPGTYRTYEQAKADGGREPPLSEIQRIAAKFKVNWVWLATGREGPDKGVVTDERLVAIADQSAKLSDNDRDLALNAALSVVETFAKRRAKP